VDDPKADDGYYVRISVRVGGKRFKTRLHGFRAEILWSPNSSAFIVNETEGGGGFDQKAYIFYVKPDGLERKDVSPPVERAFGTPVKCVSPVAPNTAVVTWLSPNRLLVLQKL